MKRNKILIFLFIFGIFIFGYSDVKAGLFDEIMNNVTDEALAKCYANVECRDSCNKDDACRADMEKYIEKNPVSIHNIERDTKPCVEFSYDNCPSRCVKNDEYKFCSPNGLSYLSCGDIKDIPSSVPDISSYAVTLLKTVVPIVLIIVSIISLVKAITAGKDDEIKKAQNSLVKKLIIAGLIFFVISIVQFIILKVTIDSTEHNSLSKCLSCFLNGTDKCGTVYYKDGYGKCYNVSNKSSFDCSK